MSVPELHVDDVHAPAQEPRMIAPRNPDGVHLDYNDASTPEGSLKRALLDTDSSSEMVAATSFSPTLTSAYGMGGVGKTCALRGLCLDRDVWRRFPDGVFFFSFGKDATAADVTASLSQLVEAVGMAEPSNRIRQCPSVKSAVCIAVVALKGLRCLLLFDDLWSTDSCPCGYLEDLKHLLDSCPSSRIVFSTRNRAIASRGGQKSVPFDSRDDETSRRILLGFTGFSDADVEAMNTEAVEALQYALRRCAGVPIVLAVTGRLILWYAARLGDKSLAWRAYKRDALKRSRSCARGPGDDPGGYPALSSALLQSLDVVNAALESDGASGCKSSGSEMYRALCVLRKQSRAPLSMLCALWGVDEERARHVAEEFEKLSLLDIEFSPELTFSIELHDLALDFCTRQSEAIDGSEERWHIALLSGYQSQQVSLRRSMWLHFGALHAGSHTMGMPRPWWSALNDGYLFKNLIRHLMMSGAVEEGKRLLLDYRFMQAQLNKNGICEVVQDYVYAINFLFSTPGAQVDRAACKHLVAIEAIEGALRMAQPTISSGLQPLTFQMTGRLHVLKEVHDGVAQFIKTVKEHASTPCLLALSQCLAPPNPALRASILMREVESAVFVPDADRVVVVTRHRWGQDGLARGGLALVLDISRAGAVYKLDGHAGGVKCVASYVVGAAVTIVTGGEDGTLRFWDAKTGVATGDHINASDGEVTAVAASTDGFYVASVSSYGRVRRWSTRLRKEAGMLAVPEGEELDVVRVVAISGDGRCVAAAIRPGKVHVWVLDDGAAGDAAPAALLGAHDNDVLTLAMSEDGCTVVSGGSDCTVRVWRVSGRAAVGAPIRTESEVISLSVIGNTKICAGLWGGSIIMHDMYSQALLKQFPQAHTGQVYSLDASADGRRLVSCGSGDHLVRFWDLNCVRGRGWEGSAESGPVSPVWRFAASADGRWVVSLHSDGGVLVWDAAKGEVDGELLAGGGRGALDCAAFSPDSQRIVCGAEDGSVRVWSIKTRREVFPPILAHDARVTSIAISADGKRIVSGSDDDTVRVWHMRSGAPVFGPLEGHNDSVNSVVITPDCRYIVSGSDDHDVRVWNMSSGDAVGEPLCGHSTDVNRVEVSADSLRIVSWDYGEARVWYISTRKCERIVERGDPLFYSSAEVLTTSGSCPAADQSAWLRVSRTEESSLIYSGDPSNEIIVGSFDSDARPTSWHYDSKRKRLWAGLGNGQVAIVYMK